MQLFLNFLAIFALVKLIVMYAFFPFSSHLRCLKQIVTYAFFFIFRHIFHFLFLVISTSFNSKLGRFRLNAIFARKNGIFKIQEFMPVFSISPFSHFRREKLIEMYAFYPFSSYLRCIKQIVTYVFFHFLVYISFSFSSYFHQL